MVKAFKLTLNTFLLIIVRVVCIILLKEIKEVLDAEDLELIEAILIRKKEQNLKEIKHLQIKQDAINRTIDSIDRYRKSPPKGTLTLEYIPERRIYSMECDVNFYDHDIDTYLRMEFKRSPRFQDGMDDQEPDTEMRSVFP